MRRVGQLDCPQVFARGFVVNRDVPPDLPIRNVARAVGYEQLGLYYMAELHYLQMLAREPGNRVAVQGLRRIRRGSG